jgi:hypothetical protein
MVSAPTRKEDKRLCSHVRRRQLHGSPRRNTREEDVKEPKPSEKERKNARPGRLHKHKFVFRPRL